MDAKTYWERIYQTKSASDLSWFQPTAARSLELIRRVVPDLATPIIDVGGGASVLVDNLLGARYENVTVLDLSSAALATARERLGPEAARVRWIEADILRVSLPIAAYGVWHDRAVFHFLTNAVDRSAYVANVRCAVRTGGYVLVSTFADDGPTRCSGLEVERYSPDALHDEFGQGFRLIATEREEHQTPAGSRQAFIYCLCRWEGP